MGEGGTIGAPAAIANAIADALAPLGIEIAELPVSPERLFRLLGARARGEAMNLGLAGKVALVTGGARDVDVRSRRPWPEKARRWP